jgi:hypothetical protein
MLGTSCKQTLIPILAGFAGEQNPIRLGIASVGIAGPARLDGGPAEAVT